MNIASKQKKKARGGSDCRVEYNSAMKKERKLSHTNTHCNTDVFWNHAFELTEAKPMVT